MRVRTRHFSAPQFQNSFPSSSLLSIRPANIKQQISSRSDGGGGGSEEKGTMFFVCSSLGTNFAKYIKTIKSYYDLIFLTYKQILSPRFSSNKCKKIVKFLLRLPSSNLLSPCNQPTSALSQTPANQGEEEKGKDKSCLSFLPSQMTSFRRRSGGGKFAWHQSRFLCGKWRATSICLGATVAKLVFLMPIGHYSIIGGLFLFTFFIKMQNAGKLLRFGLLGI